jgi:hypothetical protein
MDSGISYSKSDNLDSAQVEIIYKCKQGFKGKVLVHMIVTPEEASHCLPFKFAWIKHCDHCIIIFGNF